MELKYLRDMVDIVAINYSQDISGIQFSYNYDLVRVDIAFKKEFDFASHFSQICLLVRENVRKDYICNYVNADFENLLIQAEWEVPQE